MKAAIYHPWIYVKSGLERTIVELVKRSRHDWSIYTSHYDAEGTYPELKSMNVQEINRVSVKRSYGSVASGAATLLKTKLPLAPREPLVICCDGLGSLLNFRHKQHPLLCLCFTPLRAVYDEEYRKRHLKKHRSKLPAALAMEVAYKFVDRLAWRHYDQVYAISETVRKRIAKGKLWDASKVDLAFPGIRQDQIEYQGTRRDYFFLPGRIMWTKNIELAIDAFKELRRRGVRDYRLVIAGMVDYKSQPYFADLKERGKDVEGLDFVVGPNDAEMDRLYRECQGVLFTAFNEDLGLTPLEGMAKGKPPIAVNRGGPTEIVLDGQTGILAEPTAEAFADAMQKMIGNPDMVDRWGRAGVERAKLFTWDEFVRKIDEGIDRCAGGKAP